MGETLEELRGESANWFATTLRSIGDAVVATNEATSIKFLNATAEELTGWTLGEAKGRPLEEVFQIINEFSGQPVESPAARALKSGRVVSRANHTILIARDGRRIAIDDSAAPIFDPKGKVNGVVLVFRDVTEQRKTEGERAEGARLARFAAEVHQRLAGAESLQEMLGHCTDLAVEHLDAAFARIWTHNAAQNVLELRASSGLYTHLDGAHGRVPVGMFKIGLIAQERMPHLTNNVAGDPRVPEQEWVKREGMVAFAGYPLLVDEELVGVIAMFARKPLSNATLQALQTMARAVAAGIQRKRNQEALQEQSEWFRVTLGSIGDAVVTVDVEGRITFLNGVAEKLTRWSNAEAAGKPMERVLRLVDETTGAPAANPIERALAEGTVVGLANHTELVARDGCKVPIEDSAAPIRNPSGQIIGAVMVFHDVSERRVKEMALERSEQRFRLLGEVVPQLLWTTDALGNMEYMNERWTVYTGRATNDINWDAVVHPDDFARTLTAWQTSLASGTPYEAETRMRRYDGSYRWFVSRAVPLRDDEDRIVRWYGSCTDIHQQKVTADALREEYSLTEQLHEIAKALATELELSKVVQIITDAGTRVTRAQFGAFFYSLTDEKGESVLLYTLSGVTQEAFEKLERPSVTQLFGPSFQGSGVIRADDVREDPRFGKHPPFSGIPATQLPVVSYLAVPVVSRSGEVTGGLFFGHSKAGMFTARDEKLIIGIAAQAAAAMDVARLYKREQQAREIAEQASKSKDHFLAALSHELRTPLTPVLAILTSLEQEAAIPEVLAEDLQTVRRNVELEARLIDDLLDLTRITRGKLQLHCKTVKLGRLIHDAINTCLPELKAKRLNLALELDATSQALTADPARVMQILWNLLKNSVKFTPEGGTITVRSRVTDDTPSPAVLVEVKDTGMGIDPDRLGRIFDAFEQGNPKITKQFGGLGLGLAISKALAESHHGTLKATSDGPGHGATFTLCLPLDGCRDEFDPHEDVPAMDSSLQTIPPAIAGMMSRPLRILLVEDHADTATILIRLLRRMGHDVIHAATIASALRFAHKEMRSGGIDIVMSDLGLPDGSGLDLMRELSTTYGLRGIALSGFGMESDLEQSQAAGFSKHLIKPIDMAAVKATLAEMGQAIV